ncbi:TonB-dependent receptor [Paraburkholderia sediminicola]|uniref:TonB-dependent receptor n=1 Tax=Paraburkholderia sediminicola TaxID=458836 RepID=UPI0038B85DC4
MSAAALSAAATLAHAQAAPESPSNTTTLAPVTVTATKRSEPLQKVPVAVSVISAQDLERSGSNNVQSLVTLVPELTFKPALSSKDETLTVRGVGTNSTSPGVEPSVSTVVDGVVYARPGQATLDLLDVDHVEILRGPQGTLFGKNATAGVVNIVTQDPSKTPVGFVDTQIYQGGEQRVSAGVSGTILPGLLTGSFTALYGRYDGNVTNVHNSEEINGYNHKGFRAKFVLTPTQDIKATFIADYMYAHDSYASGVIGEATSPLFATALSPVVPSLQNRTVNYPYGPAEKDTNWGLSAQVDWNIGRGFTLTSISAYRQWLNTQYTDEAFVPTIYTAIPGENDRGYVGFTQLSQELRLTSPKGGFFDYVAGLYLQHTQDDENYNRAEVSCLSSTLPSVAPGLTPCAAGASTFAPTTGDAVFDTFTNSLAAYGEGTFHITPRLRAILGARVTHDEVGYNFSRTSTSGVAVPGINPSFASSGFTDANGLSGRAGLQFDLTNDAMIYATYSHGYKGPAIDTFFNMQQRDTAALKPEESNSYEIGIKAQTPDHRYTANLALYDAHYENYQANFFDTVAGQVVTRLINAGSVVTRGVELDLGTRPVRGLTLNGGLALTDAHVEQFACPSGAQASCNVNGTRLPFAPTFKANVSADYRHPLPFGPELELYANYFWQAREQFSLPATATTEEGAYGIMNASVALNFDSGWRIALIGKNLLNKSYVAAMANGTGYVAIAVPRDASRYFGVQLRKDFF